MMVKLFSGGSKHGKELPFKGDSDSQNSITIFTLRELKRATEGFCQTKVVGRGDLGEVFKGTLDDGTRVAIKRAKTPGAAKHQKQFLNEVKILSRASHPYVVKLIGCCFNNTEVLLVYEFIGNGTLEYHLFRAADPPNRGCSIRLDWKLRLRIAIQTAQALNYLHVQANPPIFHRDVKPANILLDGMLNVKVADFGESKLVDLDASLMSTARPKGTLGYWDPDFFRTYQVTDKVDVYSFGVVLLVLVSSQKPIDQKRPESDWNLAVKSERLLESGKIRDIIDPNLTISFSEEDIQMVEAAARVAVACVAQESRSRPSMNQVLETLLEIAEQSQLTFDIVQRNCKNKPCTMDTVEYSCSSSSIESGVEDCSTPSGFDIRFQEAQPCWKSAFPMKNAPCTPVRIDIPFQEAHPYPSPTLSEDMSSCTINRSPLIGSCREYRFGDANRG